MHTAARCPNVGPAGPLLERDTATLPGTQASMLTPPHSRSRTNDGGAPHRSVWRALHREQGRFCTSSPFCQKTRNSIRPLCFTDLCSACLTFDAQARLLDRSDRATARSERRSPWTQVLHARVAPLYTTRPIACYTRLSCLQSSPSLRNCPASPKRQQVRV
jgi:hypothetical protein